MTSEFRWPMFVGVIVLLTTVATAGRPADTRFRSAQPDYQWTFPRDHVSHPQYKTEWWYFTGIVSGDDRQFGYQFTIFRQGTGTKPRSGSGWYTDQVFMGHLALSDLENHRHWDASRVSRAHPKLAGGDTSVPGRVRVQDWELSIEENRWRIRAGDGDYELQFSLQPTRTFLFQGPNGYSSKGSEPGQASMYYSFTRMRTSGRIRTDGKTVQVSGTTWFDHEFGSSQLNQSQVGWDWISLRLSSGADLMVYRLREEGGTVTSRSSATIRRNNGNVTYLPAGQWRMEPLEYWTSPETGGRYPVKWRFESSEPDISLIVNRRFDSQEMVLEEALSAPYWEGVVRANGSIEGRTVTGTGYLEMAGYVRSLSGSF